MTYGFLEDNTGLLLIYFTGINYESTFEILFYRFFFLIARNFNSIYVLNLFIIVISLINLLASYKLFKLFINNKLISFTLGLLVIFSPYSLYQSQNHLALINIWILPTFIYLIYNLFLENYGLKLYAWYGIILGTLIHISAYLGFFGFLFSLLFILNNFIIEIINKKNYLENIRTYLLRSFLIFFPGALSMIIINYSVFYVNFYDSTATNIGPNLSRPLEDFFYFSSRPWYYFLPSVDNPIYGGFSSKVLYFLQNDWGNYLAQNYFKSEHSASFLGYTNFIFALIGIKYIFKNKNTFKNYKYLLSLLITSILLVLFSMPPYADINGIRIYFPSFLISEYLSMFRVLSRIGILVFIIQLIFVGYGLIYFSKILRERSKKLLFSNLLILVFFVLSFLELYFPVKLTDISVMPEVYSYIESQTPKDSKIIFMPRNRGGQVHFWSKDFSREVTSIDNLNLFIDGKNIDKNTFLRETLYSCKGMKLVKANGTDYFVYFYNSDEGSDKKIQFLDKNLIHLKDFTRVDQDERYNGVLYTIIYTGNNYLNQAKVYKFPDYIQCEN